LFHVIKPHSTQEGYTEFMTMLSWLWSSTDN